jgi:UTP--glucose-1-phosphate uridylyltransferase
MPDHIAAALDKMRAAGAHPAELAAMAQRLEQLDDPAAGLLSDDVLEPLEDLPALEELPEPASERARQVLDALVVVKLNGGLGTSMGLSGPKSLLEIKAGKSFLDVIVAQVLGLRERYGSRLPLVAMHSASTRAASLEVLDRFPTLRNQGVPLDFMQGREPKLRADDLQPVEWPANPDLEWCPPGHGDIYTALAATGTLNTLLDAGLRWAFVSNSDNLGALADVRIAAWVADEAIPFAMEVVRGTPADRKGGHLARCAGQMVLRETAQVPDDDTSFGEIDRWRYYNTNNLWVDLLALKESQAAEPGAPLLPLIVNRKTVDPKDKTSTQVIQLETAMGAAIGSIPGARAIQVPRSRFAPVKTTNELLVVRSDAYELTLDGRMTPTFDGPGPFVTLDDDFYKTMPDLEERFPAGAPSLRRCSRFDVRGDVTFGGGVVAEGDVQVRGPARVGDGAVLRG